MRPLRVARTRMCHAFRATNIHKYSTTSSYTKSNVTKVTTVTATAGVLAGAGLWWLTTTRDDVPTSEGRLAQHMVTESGLSKDDVTQMLSQEAYSIPVKTVPGVNRYDGAQLSSNSPCEDRFTHGRFPSPWNNGEPWMAWAVFDGHAGWQTADLLEKQLLPLVQESLSQITLPPNEQHVPEELIRRAITKTFVDLDSSIIETAQETSQGKQSLQEKMRSLTPGFSGSCALLSLYDPSTSKLYVACTGDSRAVLGQQNSDGQWKAVPLSVDQTGSNAEEIARIQQEHPGEEEIVKNGRVLGLMVSRAFGDGRWKWPLELQKEFKQSFYGPAPLTPKFDVRTPPYVTAEPVVTVTTVDPKSPSCLILATDGMWDMLTNQQAVDLVRAWLKYQAAGSRNSQPSSTNSMSEPKYGPFDFSQFGKGVNERFEEERTTIQDDNVAVHLMRNSLGGNHLEMIAGRLAASTPFSRDVRDDITVQVALFNCPGLKK